MITGLRSVDREEWANAFSALAAPHEERAAKAEAEGDSDTARREYLIAYDCQHVARYPAPNSPANWPRTESLKNIFLKPRAISIRRWSAWRCRLPDAREKARFPSVSCENPKESPSLRLWCSGAASMPSKKSAPSEPYLKAGLAPLAIDMPGVADAPLAGSENGERLWDAVFDFIASRADLDVGRVGVHGGSTGGYWATKSRTRMRHDCARR